MAPFFRAATPLLCALALAACDDGASRVIAPPDAGPVRVPDAGHDGPLPPSVCDDAFVDAVLSNDRASVSLDTSEWTGAPRDLGIGCNNDEAGEWAPQAIVRVEIPGTGPRTLRLSTKNEATDDKFVTILQVRDACAELPRNRFPAQCLMPTDDELRAVGDVAVEGGRTYFVVVTGYSEAPNGLLDRGPLQLDLEVRDTHRPELSGVTARLVGKDLEVRATVEDDDRDLAGLAAAFLDAEGRPLDLDGDREGTGADFIPFAFTANTAGLLRYTGAIRVANVGPVLEQGGAVKARIFAWDRAFGTSAPVELALERVEGAGLDEACSDDVPCRTGLTCTTGGCAAPPAVESACSSATVLNLATPAGDEATVAAVSGQLRTGEGIFAGSCASTGGRESVLAVDVPEGKFDLVARTDVGGTDQETDTVVYIRSACADPGSEVACNDEAKRGDSRSIARAYSAPAGRYHVFVEPYEGARQQVRYRVQISLRPVLASGAACDPTEAKNRCETARCLHATSRCP